MTCNSMYVSTSSTIKDSIKRSKQPNVTCPRAKLSFLDNNVFYSANHVRVLMIQSQYKYSHMMGRSNLRIPSSRSTVPNSFHSLFDNETSKEMDVEEKKELKNGEKTETENGNEKKGANWIERLLEIRSKWMTQKQQEYNEMDVVEDYSDNAGGENTSFNRETFSRWLKNVSWSDIKLFSQLAFLSNMAYIIPAIKAEDLRRYYDLEFTTSSLKKKELQKSIIAEIDRESVSSSQLHISEMTAFTATSTMTTVVSSGEEEKQEAAKSLQSNHNLLSCEWFVCDDTKICTRYFVIQGLDSMASWEAFLLFEPVKFEGTDVLVHRGIYEAEKGLYEQMMPEIMDHLEKHGEKAKLQFTGHSIGGSLCVIISLMLLIRMVVKPSTLSPVVTFGSPFVFCDGQKILHEFGLDENHIHCVIMHRDIVPRAFSSTLPNYVAEMVKRFSSALNSHDYLNTNKSLYSPMGKVFILQPHEMSSPPHCLLPPGTALYGLEHSKCSTTKSALNAFLNSPHPKEILTDPTAYGSEGTILRDHDSSNYLKALNTVIRGCTRAVVRKVKKQQSHFWPLLTSEWPNDSIKSSQELTPDDKA